MKQIYLSNNIGSPGPGDFWQNITKIYQNTTLQNGRPRPDDNCDFTSKLCWEGTFIITRGPSA